MVYVDRRSHEASRREGQEYLVRTTVRVLVRSTLLYWVRPTLSGLAGGWHDMAWVVG